VKLFRDRRPDGEIGKREAGRDFKKLVSNALNDRKNQV